MCRIPSVLMVTRACQAAALIWILTVQAHLNIARAGSLSRRLHQTMAACMWCRVELTLDTTRCSGLGCCSELSYNVLKGDSDDLSAPDPLARCFDTKDAYQLIRALPCVPGEAVIFTHRIIHWGSQVCLWIDKCISDLST